jgi:hypothetical protein
MHTAFFYFIYSIKTSEKPYNNHTNWSNHQTQVSEHHQTSTNARGRQGLVPRHCHHRLLKQSKESALCASSRCNLHLSLREPTSRVLDQSEASHQACHWRHHSAKRFLLPAHSTQHAPSIELPWNHAVKTHHHRYRRGHVAPPENHQYPVTDPKMMPPAGRAVPRIAIVRSRRPRSRVSPRVAPPPVDMCSKMMPSQEG